MYRTPEEIEVLVPARERTPIWEFDWEPVWQSEDDDHPLGVEATALAEELMAEYGVG